MYFVTVERATGRLLRLDMTPTRIRRIQIRRAEAGEAQWLWQVLKRESAPFGVDVVLRDDQCLQLLWGGASLNQNVYMDPHWLGHGAIVV